MPAAKKNNDDEWKKRIKPELIQDVLAAWASALQEGGWFEENKREKIKISDKRSRNLKQIDKSEKFHGALIELKDFQYNLYMRRPTPTATLDYFTNFLHAHPFLAVQSNVEKNSREAPLRVQFRLSH